VLQPGQAQLAAGGEGGQRHAAPQPGQWQARRRREGCLWLRAGGVILFCGILLLKH